MIDDEELALLRRSQRTHEDVQVVVNRCAYSCCGRGWRRRDGYEQTSVGYVDNLKLDDTARGLIGTFMLYGVGLGSVSYVIAARFDEVEVVEWPT